MTDKQPTQEQISELWEWCGFKVKETVNSFHEPIIVLLEHPHFGSLIVGKPELDLNNLFEFAVPKLREAVRDYEAHRILSECIRLSFSIKDKLEDRIVKAVLEVIHDGSRKKS